MSSVIRLVLIGLVLAVAWQFRGGFGDIQVALRTAGWIGVGAITLYHILPLALCGISWRSLQHGGSALGFIFARWVREGVGEIAGFLPLSGEIAGIRVLARNGIRPALAGALTVVDVTAEVMAQFFFSLIGVAVWMARHPGTDVVRWGVIGLVASLPVLAAFFLVQRSKVVRFLETLPAKLMPDMWKAPEIGAGIHAAIGQIYGDKKRVARAVAIHLGAWLLSTGEAAVGLYMLGHPLNLADVLALESIIFAIRSGAFVIPAAIGIQEGGYVLVGAALGLPPETALALSLLKRGRELVLGVPALLAWHFAERRRPCAEGRDLAS